MRVLSATAIVGPDHTLTVTVPPDITPGSWSVVLVMDQPQAAPLKVGKLDLTPINTGLVDTSNTFRREDMYGDEGR